MRFGSLQQLRGQEETGMETEAAPTEIKRKKEQVSCQPEK